MKKQKQLAPTPMSDQLAAMGPPIRVLQPEQMPALYSQPKTAKQSLGITEHFDEGTGLRMFVNAPCYKCFKRYTINVPGVLLADLDCPVCKHPGILKKDLV